MADSMAETAQIAVQVCYATPDAEFLRDLRLDIGSTLRQAIEASGVLALAADIDLATAAVGIYGKKRTLDTVLREHDRVEIYRPLQADPKEARRRRAHART